MVCCPYRSIENEERCTGQTPARIRNPVCQGRSGKGGSSCSRPLLRPTAREGRLDRPLLCRFLGHQAQQLGARLAAVEIELTFVETGSMTYNVNNHVLHLRRGHMTITRPWQLAPCGHGRAVAVSRLRSLLDVECAPNQSWQWPSWLIMTKRDRGKLTNMLRHNEQAVWVATPEIRRCFRGIMGA